MITNYLTKARIVQCFVFSLRIRDLPESINLENIFNSLQNLIEIDIRGLSKGGTSKRYIIDQTIPTGICRAMILCDCITSIVIQDCSLSDKSIESLLGDSSDFCSLINLDLSYNKIGCIGAAHLSNTVLSSNLGVLSCLKLSHNIIGKDGALAIGNSIRVNSTIKQLDLKFNKLKNEGGTAILNCIRGNVSLINLNLSSNMIGDAITASLKSMIEAQSNQLENLDLSLNDISKATMESLESLLKINECHQLHIDFRMNMRENKENRTSL